MTVTLLSMFVASAVTWLIAHGVGYRKGLAEGKKKGFKHGFFEAEGRHDA